MNQEVVTLGIGLSILGVGGGIVVRHPLFFIKGGIGAVLIFVGAVIL